MAPADENRPALKNQASRFPGPRGERPAARPHQLPREGCRGQRRLHGGRARRARVTSASSSTTAVRRVVVPLQPKSYDVVYSDDWTGTATACTTSPSRPTPARHPEGRRHLPRERHPHRVRAAQARDQADVLPLRVGAGRQPHRVRQRRRAAAARPRLSRSSWTRGRASARGQAWGMKTIETFHTHGTPPVAASRRVRRSLAARRDRDQAEDRALVVGHGRGSA